MPLSRDHARSPIVDLDILTVRFPMIDGARKSIWGEVSDLALRERAITDGVTGEDNLLKRALFERYRSMLELLASELFDEGKYGTPSDGATVVRVPNGRF
jgi:hypothetical protein